jgi:hypothetical protein
MNEKVQKHQAYIADELELFKPENYPTFLVMGSWFALHNCYSCQEPLEKIVNPADRIRDHNCSSEGRLFGFKDDAKGVDALETLLGLAGGDVYIHDGKGSYIAADDNFLNELGIRAKGVDLQKPDALKNFIGNFLQLAQQQKYPVISIKPQ